MPDTLPGGDSYAARAAGETGGFGISYQCFPSPVWDISERVARHAAARKYKARADAWLGLAGVVGAACPVVLAAWRSDSWEPDPDLERLSRSEPRPGKPSTKQLSAKERAKMMALRNSTTVAN